MSDDFRQRLQALRSSFGDDRDTPGGVLQSRNLGALTLEEVENASDSAGPLFRRVFKLEIPDFPRHFVLTHRRDGAREAIGYAHHTRAGRVHLGGGLVVSALSFRKLDAATADLVRAEGGLAEWIVRTTVGWLDGDAVFLYMGDKVSIRVNSRAGFAYTGVPHLYVLWKTDLPAAEQAALVAKIAAFGPF